MLLTIELEDKTLSLESERLAVEDFYHFIQQNPYAYHKQLVKYYEKEFIPKAGPDQQLEYLGNVLRSALWVGDFLNISAYMYKTNKRISEFSHAAQARFLPAYYEICALYNFYENDIPQSLREMELVLTASGIDEAMRRRCTMYRLAILLAAHLPSQGIEDIRKYKHTIFQPQDAPIIALLSLIFAIETNRKKEEVEELAIACKEALPPNEPDHPVVFSFYLIEKYLQRDPVACLTPPPRLFADGWENILRVDLWIKAKMEVKFYYNLLVEGEWQKRKKVF